jgi:hypothetical protein
VGESTPVLRRRQGDDTWDVILRGAGALALAATLLIILVPGASRLVVFVLLTLWCHGPLSPLLPAAYEPVLLAYGRLFPPLLVAIVGALTSTGVEYLNYQLYRKLLEWDSFDRVLRSPHGRRVIQLYVRRPFLTVWLCVWSPLPDWAARILAAHSGYSVRRYLSAFLLARIPRFWLLAEVGMHWLPSGGAVLAVAAGFAGVALIGLLRRPNASASPPSSIPASESHMRTTLLLLLVSTLPAMPGMVSGTLAAQEAAGRLPDGPALGGSMDRSLYEGSGITAVSFRLSSLRRNGVGSEVGVSLFPEALPGGLLLAPDLGPAYNISLPGATILLKAGGSAILGIGQGIGAIPACI